jgi:hypothetical protein
MAEEFGHSVEPARMPPIAIGSECRDGRDKNPYVPRRDINNSHLCAQPLFPVGSPSSRRSPHTPPPLPPRAQSTTGQFEFELKHVTPRPVALPQFEFRLANARGEVLGIDAAALERWFHTGDMSYEDQDTGEGEDAERQIK